MIQSSFVENRSVFFRALSDDQVWEIRQAAFDVLEKTGCNVLHEGAAKLLKKAGAIVKDEGQSYWRVKVPRYIVEECIRTAPKGFTIYDRDGNRAMARFLETETETARWLRDRVPKARRVHLLGGLLFAAESGLVARRLKWDIGNELRRMAELELHGLGPEDAALGLALLRQDLPTLNEARRHVVGSNSR